MYACVYAYNETTSWYVYVYRLGFEIYEVYKPLKGHTEEYTAQDHKNAFKRLTKGEVPTVSAGGDKTCSVSNFWRSF